MQALAERSPDTNAHRQDEPYRRALTGVYARLAATLKDLTGRRSARHAVAPQNPYRMAEEFLADLRTIEDSLLATMVRPGRAAPAPADPRGGGVRLSPGHGRPAPELGPARSVVAELLATARIEPDYAALDEDARRALLLRLLNDAGPCACWAQCLLGAPTERAGHL
jgi:phosphoenolpyruvate carboxylase